MEDDKNPQDQQPQAQDPQGGQQNPDEKKDRTAEQFDKLKQANQNLKQERDLLEQENKSYQSVLDSLMPDPTTVPPPAQQYQQPINQAPQASNFSNLNQKQVNDAFSSMVDENGYLDGNKLMQTLQAMDQKAKKAEEKAQIVEQRLQQRDQQDSETRKQQTTNMLHEKFPMLNPDNKEQFNPDFWQAVVDGTFRKMMMEGVEDPVSVAERLQKTFYPEAGDDVTKKEQAQQAENQKRQSNATRPRSSMNVGYYANEEESALVGQVRQGKKGAVAEMLRRRGQ